MESILTSIKKLLGINSDYTHFDPDIVMHINTVLMDLTMLGVGPRSGFSIEDDTAVWSDFLSNPTDLAGIKSYIYLRVKLLFDASTLSAAHIESINEQIKKFEWTLNVAAEDNGSTGSDSSGGSGSIDSSVVEELNALVAALQATNNSLKSSNATLSAENTILKLSNESLESSNAELQVSNISLSTRNTELEKRNSDLLASNEILQNENSELENQNGELIASNETLQNENAELEESNAALTARVEELEAAGSTEELENLIDKSGVLESTDGTATDKVEQLIDFAEFKHTIQKSIDNIAAANDNCTIFNGWLITEEQINMFDFSKVTKFNSTFRNNKNLKNIVIDTQSATQIAYICQNCTELESVELTDTSKVVNINSPFVSCPKLKSIKTLNFSSLTAASNPLTGLNALEELRFVPETIKIPITISSPVLSDESIQSVTDGLATVETAQTLTVHSTVYAKITEDQWSTIESKNWRVE